MKSSVMRVGIIGAGGIARAVHLPGWKAIKGVEVVGVADVNQASAAALAQDFGVKNVFTNYHDLLKLGLDVVDVCAPNQVHTPAVIAGLKSGANVYCEKPLAVTTREVIQMGTLADKLKLKLMTGQHHRFSTDGLTARSHAASGALGKIYHARVKANRRAWLPPSPGFIDHKLSGGGPCMDIGVHALDFCMTLMEFPQPERVSGTAKTNFAKGYAIPNAWGEWDRKRYTVEDFAAGFVHFKGGATMTLEASWLGHEMVDEDMSCQVFGMKGGLIWPSAQASSVEGGKMVVKTLKRAREVKQAHGAAIAAFHQAVLKNKKSPVPWTETLKVITILEAIYASQKKGREVKISY